ncbi:MAG: serine/threonine protein kinase, partial [Planctomycetota bacterium]
IVHRDIKPSNIVMDGDNPCIVDFGLARDGQDVVRTTMDGHVSGTLLYMSPEQIRSGGSTITLDGRTDIYSLGATLFELLKGKPPHEAQNPGQVIHEILERDPGQPTNERDLATIVTRAMDKDRERRFVTALEMAEDLERYLRQEPIFSRPVGVTTRVWKLAKRNRNASFAVGAAAVVAIGLGSVLWWNVEQRAAARTEAVQRVEEQIDLKMYETAEGLLNAMVDEGPGPDTQRIENMLAACLQLEELLDEVQCRTEDVDPNYLSKLMDVDRSALPVDRLPEIELACPLALALMERNQDALTQLRKLPPSDGRNALIAAIEDPNGDWNLAPAAQQSPVDRLMVALAMRFARRPLAERRSQIDGARKLDEHNARLSLQDAIQVMNEGDHNTAYKFLQGQASSVGRRRTLQRLLLREAIYAPRYQKDVGPRVEAMIADHPWQEWSPADAGTVLDALYWLEDKPSERTKELLKRALNRWPNDWYLQIQTALNLMDSDRQQAEKLIAGSYALAKTVEQRDESLVTLLSQRVWQIPLMLVPWQRDPSEEETLALERTQIDARQALKKASTKAAVRDITIVLARAALTLGDIEEARNLVEQLDSSEVAVVLETSQQAVAYLWATSGTSEWQITCRREAERVVRRGYLEQLQVARVALLDIQHRVTANNRFLGRRADFHYWLLRTQIAFGCEDASDGQVAVRKLKEILKESPASGYEALINFLAKQLER